MAFWKVYKYRHKNQYMYNWIWWYKTIGQYPKEQWDEIKEELRRNKEKNKKEARQALNQLVGMTAALCAHSANSFLR